MVLHLIVRIKQFEFLCRNKKNPMSCYIKTLCMLDLSQEWVKLEVYFNQVGIVKLKVFVYASVGTI